MNVSKLGPRDDAAAAKRKIATLDLQLEVCANRKAAALKAGADTSMIAFIEKDLQAQREELAKSVERAPAVKTAPAKGSGLLDSFAAVSNPNAALKAVAAGMEARPAADPSPDTVLGAIKANRAARAAEAQES